MCIASGQDHVSVLESDGQISWRTNHERKRMHWTVGWLDVDRHGERIGQRTNISDMLGRMTNRLIAICVRTRGRSIEQPSLRASGGGDGQMHVRGTEAEVLRRAAGRDVWRRGRRPLRGGSGGPWQYVAGTGSFENLGERVDSDVGGRLWRHHVIPR